MIRCNRSSATLFIALTLGWTWDLFFYGRALGVSVPLFVLLLLAALFCVSWMESVWPRWRNLWLLLPLAVFATMVFVRANPFLTALNIMACLALLGLVTHFFASGQVETLGLIGYPLVLAQTGLDGLILPPPLVSASIDTEAVRDRGRHNLLPMARGLLLALPVLTVFSGFLASADLIFADHLETLLSLDFLSDLSEWAWRGMIILGVAWAIAGGLIHALKRHRLPGPISGRATAAGTPGQVAVLGFVEVATLLSSVDLLFLAFVWIQFTYLFGGQANITAEGYTYAEYARRGFFELLAVALLALGMLLSLHRLTRRETERREDAFAALGSVMVLAVLAILASAFQRLLLYEEAFGYTELRLYSHVFMAWLGFTLLWFLAVLWLRSDRFAFGAFVAALGFLITLNVINPDAFIARQNLSRYAVSGTLDIRYLTTLSEDVVPVLVRSRDQLNAADRQALDRHLRQRLLQMERNRRWQHWPAYHLARQRAYDLLVKSQAENGLQSLEPPGPHAVADPG